MNTKHTQGQWVKGTNTSKRDWMHIFCNGKMIAQVKELSKKGQRKATDFDEEGANAKLIAAAPELLTALEYILPLLREQADTIGSDYEKNALATAIEAITKATL